VKASFRSIESDQEFLRIDKTARLSGAALNCVGRLMD
jgi:hypothetical protein